MAGTLITSTLQGTTLTDGTNSTSTTNCIQGSAKAWVNFNGVTTATIRASYNVSSITRNGTGDYTVNFTNALTDANYGVNTTSGQAGGSGAASSMARVASVTTPLTTTSCRVYSLDPPQSNLTDVSVFSVSVFR